MGCIVSARMGAKYAYDNAAEAKAKLILGSVVQFMFEQQIVEFEGRTEAVPKVEISNDWSDGMLIKVYLPLVKVDLTGEGRQIMRQKLAWELARRLKEIYGSDSTDPSDDITVEIIDKDVRFRVSLNQCPEYMSG
jgi:hypothetical protein